MVGVDALWGDWFAYRAALVTETRLPATPTEDRSHPYQDCMALHPGLSGASPGLRKHGHGGMPRAAADRGLTVRGGLVRLACNVGSERRYEPSQIRHSAAGSLAAIRRLVARRPSE